MKFGISGKGVSENSPIVCFSHINWDDESNQRPRQILSRLATLGHPVYYFACAGQQAGKQTPSITTLDGNSSVHVYTMPYNPEIKRWAGVRRWTTGLRIARILARHRVDNPVLWFYHPLLFALGYSYADSAIVYDVTENFVSEDESQNDLYFEELTLLAEADVVFIDGPVLEAHARSMIADLTAGGVNKVPHAAIHSFPTPAAAPDWDRITAEMKVIVSRNHET